MSEALINKAKNAILGDIRKTLPGTGNLLIKVEAHGGVEYFRQALELPEIQDALRQKNLTVTIHVIDPLSIVKEYILTNLRSVASGETRPVVIQALEQDADLHHAALRLPEVQNVIQNKRLKIQVQVIGKDGRIKPDIIIATYDDIARGRLNQQ